jgi:hypothetical protein
MSATLKNVEVNMSKRGLRVIIPSSGLPAPLSILVGGRHVYVWGHDYRRLGQTTRLLDTRRLSLDTRIYGLGQTPNLPKPKPELRPLRHLGTKWDSRTSLYSHHEYAYLFPMQYGRFIFVSSNLSTGRLP